MKNKTNSILKNLAYAFIVVAATVAAHATDVSGNWTWIMPGRNGDLDHNITLTLKANGSALTGNISIPGREVKIIDTPINDGKVDGDTVSFIIVRENKGGSTTNTYSGTFTADQITGKIEFTRDGTPQSHDWTAKRVGETK